MIASRSSALVALVIVALSSRLPDSIELRFSAASLSGLLLFLLASVFLMLGNLLMTPVEALFRRRFIAQARMLPTSAVLNL